MLKYSNFDILNGNEISNMYQEFYMGPFEIPHITKQVQTKFEEGNNEEFFLINQVEAVSENILQDQVSENIHSKASVFKYIIMVITL